MSCAMRTRPLAWAPSSASAPSRSRSARSARVQRCVLARAARACESLYFFFNSPRVRAPRRRWRRRRRRRRQRRSRYHLRCHGERAGVVANSHICLSICPSSGERLADRGARCLRGGIAVRAHPREKATADPPGAGARMPAAHRAASRGGARVHLNAQYSTNACPRARTGECHHARRGARTPVCWTARATSRVLHPPAAERAPN